MQTHNLSQGFAELLEKPPLAGLWWTLRAEMEEALDTLRAKGFTDGASNAVERQQAGNLAGARENAQSSLGHGPRAPFLSLRIR